MAENRTISTVHIGSEDLDIVDTRSGYIKGITSSDVGNALGYTPYNAANPNNYQTAQQVSNAINSAIGDAIGAGY